MPTDAHVLDLAFLDSGDKHVSPLGWPLQLGSGRPVGGGSQMLVWAPAAPPRVRSVHRRRAHAAPLLTLLPASPFPLLQGGFYDNNKGLDYHVPVKGGSGTVPTLRVVHVAAEMAPIAKVG